MSINNNQHKHEKLNNNPQARHQILYKNPSNKKGTREGERI